MDFSGCTSDMIGDPMNRGNIRCSLMVLLVGNFVDDLVASHANFERSKLSILRALILSYLPSAVKALSYSDSVWMRASVTLLFEILHFVHI